jgi:hypothetical protein
MHRAIPLLLVVASLFACDRSATTAGTAPAAGPAAATAVTTPLMQPFQGAWRFDLQKTLALWQAQGVPQSDIVQVRTLAKAITIHHDMTIIGNAAVFARSPQGSYDFFALHPHNPWVCGKAWLHEDRQDPGDMVKCYARLELKEDGRELHLSTRMHDDAADPTDPDVANSPVTAGSATSCGADAETNPPWSPWRTYVFVKG